MSPDSTDTIGRSLWERQFSDWRGLRFKGLDSPEVCIQLAELAAMVKTRIIEFDSIMEAAQPSESATQPESRFEKLLRRIDKEDLGTQPAASQPVRIATERTAETQHGQPYKIYTTEFDELLPANKFVSGQEAVALTRLTTALASDLAAKNKSMLAQLSSDLERFRGEKTASVMLLLDNSGSMRGGPIRYLSAWTLLLTETLEGAGFNTEVIGFTTRAWKGGFSREKWLAEGRPSNPGRLNDLRYIVYKNFDQSFVDAVQNFGVMLRENILKENIDGEAIEYGLARLGERDAEIKLLLVMSDGAPVDDSTASANDKSFLENHLIAVLKSATRPDIKVGAVGIEHDVKRYFGSAGRNSSAEKIGLDASRVIRTILDVKGGPRKPASKRVRRSTTSPK